LYIISRAEKFLYPNFSRKRKIKVLRLILCSEFSIKKMGENSQEGAFGLKSFFMEIYRCQILDLLQQKDFEMVYRIPVDATQLFDYNPSWADEIMSDTEEFLVRARDSLIDAQIEIGNLEFQKNSDPVGNPLELYVKEL
jgi:hypothetical protein